MIIIGVINNAYMNRFSETSMRCDWGSSHPPSHDKAGRWRLQYFVAHPKANLTSHSVSKEESFCGTHHRA